MKSYCFCEKILPNALHLNSKSRVIRASVHVTPSLECDWIVSFLKNQHSAKFFITINDKISTKFIIIFVSLYQLLWSQISKMTIIATHYYWNISKTYCKSLLDSIIDLPTKCCKKWGPVGLLGNTTFFW
jgi:hypothetical protein